MRLRRRGGVGVEPNKPEKLLNLVDALSAARLPERPTQPEIPTRKVLLIEDGRATKAVSLQSFPLRLLLDQPMAAQGGSSSSSAAKADSVKEASSKSIRRALWRSVLFRTTSGNIYEISRDPENRWQLDNARNGKKLILADTQVWNGEVRVGRELKQEGFKTGCVAQVFAVSIFEEKGAATDVTTAYTLAAKRCSSEISWIRASQRELREAAVPHIGSPIRPEVRSRPVLLPSGRSMCLGKESVSVELKKLIAPSSDAPSELLEVFFRTKSGNLYGIFRRRDNSHVILNSRSGTGEILEREGLAKGHMQLGKALVLADNVRTSPVSQIISTSKLQRLPQEPSLEQLRNMAMDLSAGNISWIRRELIEDCCARLGRDNVKKILRAQA